mmetsp:Transcript_34897/g.105219  ORF Transcript_34897/g.105219 Transcript_34897/m.105219 type:complete len:212 (+) Transcript_34897:263-898(+)
MISPWSLPFSPLFLMTLMPCWNPALKPMDSRRVSSVTCSEYDARRLGDVGLATSATGGSISGDASISAMGLSDNDDCYGRATRDGRLRATAVSAARSLWCPRPVRYASRRRRGSRCAREPLIWSVFFETVASRRDDFRHRAMRLFDARQRTLDHVVKRAARGWRNSALGGRAEASPGVAAAQRSRRRGVDVLGRSAGRPPAVALPAAAVSN